MRYKILSRGAHRLPNGVVEHRKIGAGTAAAHTAASVRAPLRETFGEALVSPVRVEEMAWSRFILA